MEEGLFINALGAVTTLAVLIVIGVTKFKSGAWMVIFLIPAVVFFFKEIKSHYMDVGRKLSRDTYHLERQTVKSPYHAIVPISGIHPGVVRAIEYAQTISDKVIVCYVDIDHDATEKLKKVWEKWAQGIELTIIPSPYRSVIGPLVEFIDKAHAESGRKNVSIVVPEFITRRWYHQFLHNQMTLVLKTTLRLKPGKVVTTIRYHL